MRPRQPITCKAVAALLATSAIAVLAAPAASADVTTVGETVSALLGDASPEKVVATLVHADVPVRGFGVLAADLEEMFVQLTGEGFDVSG